ncbi:MAG: amidohydrolase family protein [Syntrophaceticus sp.]|nr:amidohydrolase family protein [Syntrophaceticus sp.]
MQLIELCTKDNLIIDAGALFTGIDQQVNKNVRVYIWDGKVQSIEKQAVNSRVEKPVGGMKNRRVIPANNMTVVPGLLDCHVHLALDGVSSPSPHRSVLRGRIRQKLASDLAYGIVAVRDGGDRDDIGLVCRDKVNNMELKGPVVMASGNAVRKKGEYGSFLGAGTTSKELAKTMKKLLMKNINQVKVLVSGIVSFKEYGRVGKIQFSLQELEQIVKIAGEHGLKVMAHASSDEAVQLCIGAGVHSIEHGYFISEDSLKEMADRGIAWIPTVIPVAVQNQQRVPSKIGKAAVIEHTYQRQLRMIRLAQHLGVLLGVGTDAGAAGVQHGVGYMQELQLYQETGLTLEETLLAATRNSAQIMGMKDSLGIIAPGRPAYLLLMEGDIFANPGKQFDIKYLIRPQQEKIAEGSYQSA